MFWTPDGPYGYYEFSPEPERPGEHFCLDRKCACSHTVLDADSACWACGGETSRQRPAWWPWSGANQVVRGGQSWDPSEEEEQEAGAA